MQPLQSEVYTRLYDNTPDLERLRSSNEPATDSEASFLDKDVFPGLTDYMNCVDNEIVASAATLKALLRERITIHGVDKRFRGLKGPHRSLPTEVWLEIFHHAAAGHHPEPRIIDAYGVNSRIWDCGQVCQNWRRIIHGRHCAYLWATIYLPLHELETLDASACVARLEYVLARSENHPLTIEVSDDPEETRVVDEHRPRLLEVLFSHSHRWREARFAQIEDPHLLFPKLQSRLPRLEELKFWHRDTSDIHDPLERLRTIHGFSDCPMLQGVEIEGKRWPIDLPWSQITKLCNSSEQEHEEDIISYTRLLEDCSSLKTFSMMHLCIPDPMVPASVDMITSSIEKLDVPSEYVLNHLILPNLREIHLNRETSSLFSFRDLLTRSDCASKITVLTIIRVHTRRGEPSILLPVLLQLLNLVELDLRACLRYVDGAGNHMSDTDGMEEITKLVLGLAIDDPTVDIYLPRLQDLSISIWDHMERDRFPYFGTTEFELVRMLQARARATSQSRWAKLKRFHFSATARAGLARSVNRGPSWPQRHYLLTRPEVRELKALCAENDLDWRISVHVHADIETMASEACLELPPPEAKSRGVDSRGYLDSYARFVDAGVVALPALW